MSTTVYSEHFAADPEGNSLTSEQDSDPITASPPSGPIEPASINFDAARQWQEDLDTEWSASHPIELINYESRLLDITVRDGAKISVKVSCPTASRLGTRTSLPIIFVLHGGGYISGSHLSEEAWTIRALQERLDFVTVSVEYRLAPANKFPIWLDDAWDVLYQLLHNSNHFVAGLAATCDISRLILLGSSAGAGICAVLSQKCRDQGISISGIILNVPMLCAYTHFPSASGTSRSYYECNQGNLGSPQLAGLWNALFASESGKDSRVSPLLGKLGGLPQHLVVVAGRDPLRDEGVEYARRLEGVGVEVRLRVFGGVGHPFAQDRGLEAARRFAEELEGVVRRWFEGT